MRTNVRGLLDRRAGALVSRERGQAVLLEALAVACRRLLLDGTPVDPESGEQHVLEIIVSGVREQLGERGAPPETVCDVGYRLRDLA